LERRKYTTQKTHWQGTLEPLQRVNPDSEEQQKDGGGFFHPAKPPFLKLLCLLAPRSVSDSPYTRSTGCGMRGKPDHISHFLRACKLGKRCPLLSEKAVHHRVEPCDGHCMAHRSQHVNPPVNLPNNVYQNNHLDLKKKEARHLMQSLVWLESH